MAGLVIVLGPSMDSPPRAGGDETVAAALQRLGADVCSGPLFADVDELLEKSDDAPRCLVVDGELRPDLVAQVLRHARKFAALEATPALVAIPARSLQAFEPSSGFDDFLVLPCTPVEIYARIRQLEWRKSEFSTEERTKIGAIVIDRALHEVTIDGRRVVLTAREFALLAFFAANRGRVLRRDLLLARVWGHTYEGGARTVDIHVRRLRAKLGDALPLETLRGAGYLLRTPSQAPDAPTRARASALRVAR
jgi:DNA-binding response OmpR family regulator